jgi:hypothetical protein
MPETTFFREAIVPRSRTEASSSNGSEGEKAHVETRDIEGNKEPMKPLRGYVSSLKMWNGVYKTKSNPFTLLMRLVLTTILISH